MLFCIQRKLRIYSLVWLINSHFQHIHEKRTLNLAKVRSDRIDFLSSLQGRRPVDLRHDLYETSQTFISKTHFQLYLLKCTAPENFSAEIYERLKIAIRTNQIDSICAARQCWNCYRSEQDRSAMPSNPIWISFVGFLTAIRYDRTHYEICMDVDVCIQSAGEHLNCKSLRSHKQYCPYIILE